ncbi:IS256 family transposase, partial [bacterium]
VWEELEGWVRVKVQQFVQSVLEEEVTEFLGRSRSERRVAVDAETGYRNGYGKPRRLTLSCGTVEVRRPRVRDAEQRFESRVLPLFARRSEEVSQLIPELYLHGLAEGDFDLALRGLLGEEAPVSASTVARLKASWQNQLEAWRSRPLDGLEVVYLWVDGVYVKAGLEKEKAAVLVALAGLADGHKVVLAVVPGHRESSESWAALLRDLRERGMNCPRLVVGDGHLGIWGALAQVYPEAGEQRCWNHKIINVLNKLPKKLHGQAKLHLRAMAYADSRAEAERLRRVFEQWCGKQGQAEAARTLGRDWERMVSFFSFPRAHWRHLRTTNPVESPFAALRLRTDAARRFKRVDNATAVIWKLLLLAESKFRRLNASELLKEVFLGVAFIDGIRSNHLPQEAAA